MSIEGTASYLNNDFVKRAQRIIVKIGSSMLTYESGKLNLRRIETLVKVLSDISNSGREVILVSSGAVSAGAAILMDGTKLEKIEDKKAAAAVGQAELMNIYSRFFASYGKKVAQILLTRDVIDNDTRRKNAEETFSVLLRLKCIPIVNENDTVSSDEIKFSGNDILSAYVSVLCRADLLINLSDRNGLYNKNPAEFPDAEFVQRVEKIDDTILSYAGGAGTSRGTGGMIAKLQAAIIAAEHKIPMIIANGSNPEIIYDLCDGIIKGTLLNI